MSAIAVKDLRKAYGEHEAVRGIAFEIAEGEVFGLLGPNGAGKTTTVEILEGYRKRDGGEVTVLGEDPQTAGRALARADRRRAPVVAAVAEPDRRRDAPRSSPATTRRPRDVDEVIRLVGLEEKRDARVKTLSGGQKRRLDLGLALVGDPELVFLDEPTTGFDPTARRRGLGHDPVAARAREDGAPDHALPRRGASSSPTASRSSATGEIVTVGTPRDLTSAAADDRDPLPPERRRRRARGPTSRRASSTS